MIEEIEVLIRAEVARQVNDDNVLLFDDISGMVDGVLDVRSVATGVQGAVASQRLMIADNGGQTT
jgi:hypothetical protein